MKTIGLILCLLALSDTVLRAGAQFEGIRTFASSFFPGRESLDDDEATPSSAEDQPTILINQQGKSVESSNKQGTLQDPTPNDIPSPAYEELYPSPGALVDGQPVSITDNNATDLEADEYRKNKIEYERRLALSHELMSNIRAGNAHLFPTLISQFQSMMDIGKQPDSITMPHQFAFLGDQTVGKSFVMNCLTRLGSSVMNAAIGTKALVHTSFRRSEDDSSTFKFRGTECTWNELLSRLRAYFRSLPDVVDEEIHVEITTPWIPFPMDFYDIPGITQSEETRERKATVLKIIKRVAQNSNVVFVWVTDATQDPDTRSREIYTQLTDTGVPDSRIIRVLNKVNKVLEEKLEPADIANRIESWFRWHQLAKRRVGGQTASDSDYVPFLISVDKKTDFDAIRDLTPREQVNRWTEAIDQGEKFLQSFLSQHKILSSYPRDRIGINQLSSKLNGMITSAVITKLQSAAATIGSTSVDSSTANQKESLNIDQSSVSEALYAFFEALSRRIEEMGFNKGGDMWIDLAHYGGRELQESLTTLNQRNKECMEHFQYGKFSADPPPYPGYMKRSSVAQPGSTFDPARPYSLAGAKILNTAFELNLRHFLERFLNLDDAQLEQMVGEAIRTNVYKFDELVAFAVSKVAKDVNIKELFRSTIGKLACSMIRIIRAAIFSIRYMPGVYSEHAPIWNLLFQSEDFRRVIEQGVHELMANKTKVSQEYMERVTSEQMDHIISFDDAAPWSSIIMNYFSDITQDDFKALEELPNALKGAAFLSLKPSDSRQANLQQTFDWVRQATKVFYSLRTALALSQFNAHYHREWKRALEHDRITPLIKRLKERSRNPIETFNLQKLVERTNGRSNAKLELQRTIQQGAAELQHALPPFLAEIKHMNLLNNWSFEEESKKSTAVPNADAEKGNQPDMADQKSPSKTATK